MLLKCVPAVSPRLVDKSEADFNFCLWQVLRYLGCKRKYHWDRKLNFEIIISLEHSQGINNKYKPRIIIDFGRQLKIVCMKLGQLEKKPS